MFDRFLIQSGCCLALACVNLQAAGFQWVQGKGYRSAVLPAAAPLRDGFTLLPPAATGLDFTNILSNVKAAENQIRLNGSGVACGDVEH